MRKVVGLIGVKGSGKDTAAAFLVKERGFKRVAFADALYHEVAEAFGVSIEFLGNRDTKESPLPQLSLGMCKDHRFVAVMAHHLKKENESIAEFLKEPRSPRVILQYWGTEYRRVLDDDAYWLNQVRSIIAREPDQNFVITDVRFGNEAKAVVALNGELVRVRRPVLETREAAEREKKGTAAHPSEVELLTWPTNYEFINEEGNPDSLRAALFSIFTPALAV